MKLKFICYLKSGAVVSDEIEFVESATVEDVDNNRIKIKDFINNGIKDKQSGTISFGYTHVNIQEISAYSLKMRRQPNVYSRICMRHLGNHRRRNPIADWLCHCTQEKVKMI